MTQEALEKMLAESIAEEREKMRVHEYIDLTVAQNGRGAIDGGSLYLQTIDKALEIMQKAVAKTLAQVLAK